MYFNFKYKYLKLYKIKFNENETIIATIQVENQSNYKGSEVIQLYIQDLYSSVVRPVKELKGFQKISFEPYEIKNVQFEINVEMLKFWNEKLEYIAEKGDFKVFVGSDSVNVLEEKYELI